MPSPIRRTKIIFTAGPACDSAEMLEGMIVAGADICRVNMAHASHEWTRRVMRRVRDASAKLGREVAILMDVKGPEIRTGDLPAPLQLQVGDLVDFTLSAEAPTQPPAHAVPVNYPGLGGDVQAGDTVLVDSGLLRMEVLGKEVDRVRCRVAIPGVLGNRRHINLPGIRVNLPSLTDKDRRDLAVGLEEGIDFVALSFVREKSDIATLRQLLEENGSKARIIAKVEDQQAVNNIEEIIQASDGLMVARGDLGIECPLEMLPGIQRRAVRLAISAARPVIIATHMLESMIQSTIPTRAEVTDVANAVNELADAVMLSGESSVGKHPLECLRVLDRISRRVESEQAETLLPDLDLGTDKGRMLRSAAALACQTPGSCLVVFTRYGYMAQGLAALRPARAPIYAFTNSRNIQRQLRLHRGVEPFVLQFLADPEQTIRNALKLLAERGSVQSGDKLIIVTDIIARDRLVDSIQLRVVD